MRNKLNHVGPPTARNNSGNLTAINAKGARQVFLGFSRRITLADISNLIGCKSRHSTNISALLALVRAVIGRSSREKMRGIATASVVTVVENIKRKWVCSGREKQGNPMGAIQSVRASAATLRRSGEPSPGIMWKVRFRLKIFWRIANANLPVPKGVFMSGPLPAFIGSGDSYLGPKTCALFFGNFGQYSWSKGAHISQYSTSLTGGEA